MTPTPHLTQKRWADVRALGLYHVGNIQPEEMLPHVNYISTNKITIPLSSISIIESADSRGS